MDYKPILIPISSSKRNRQGVSEGGSIRPDKSPGGRRSWKKYFLSSRRVLQLINNPTERQHLLERPHSSRRELRSHQVWPQCQNPEQMRSSVNVLR
ncbi:hypothetical protein GCK72_022611 [Caenorhabditis remanei]|uniref:Uncharacterized protein n=1 Tax=Caenorhabditis remanei TaxID=31234 RepID=A0A6A5FU65_CAERE|nr:hypothetical protein GCK72_022611 [Caenorhabditis remanei]KAF1746158.1 hypothetical protein GCK72_022611 [Caenorhabditis remanei]